MKSLGTIITLIFLNSLIQHSFGQDGVVWTRIPDSYQLDIKETKDGITSNSVIINELVKEFHITKLFPAVPSSRNVYLRDLYQIECENCDEISLIQRISKESSLFDGPEHGPRYETLNVPDDYSLAVPFDYALELINARYAWELTEGDENIIISISDAGYDMGINELNSKIVSVSSGISNSNIAHGTAVAATAAGTTNNAFGKSSIGYKSRLDLRGMNYNELLSAAYSGAKIVNASWAAGCYNSSYGQMIIDEIIDAGVIVVAAAGNGSTCNNASALVYPASYNNVISVTSIGATDNHEGTPGNTLSTHQHNLKVDLCAPGYGVALALPGNGFTFGNGSSFAAPFVSGTIALMLAVNPCLNYEDVEYILKASADTNVYLVNPSIYNGLLGAGRLDAFKAVEMAMKYSTMSGSVSHVVVCDFNEQVLFLDSLDGAAPFEIAWSNGETSSMCPVGPTGNYWVMATDSNGCRFYEEMEMFPVLPISIQGDMQHLSCANSTDGQISLTINGGNGLFEAEWSNGMTGFEVNGLGVGNYQVIVTDGNGCQSSEYFSITAPEALSLDFEIIHPSPLNSGSVMSIVNGGTGNYSYQWSNGETGSSLNNLDPGIYQLTVKDDNLCTAVKLAIVQYQDMVGVVENSIETLTVYPNPASEHIIIEFSNTSEFRVELIDLMGKTIVRESNFFSGKIMDVSNYEKGTYLLKVYHEENEIGSRRVVIQ